MGDPDINGTVQNITKNSDDVIIHWKECSIVDSVAKKKKKELKTASGPCMWSRSLHLEVSIQIKKKKYFAST